jgi:hypothetical protein
MIIHGRIDRIDVNKQTGEIAVLDYKTGDTTEEPRRNHLKGQEWIDWQLPLYGVLIKTIKDLEIKDISKVHFGYILLPKNVPDTKFILANFSSEEHAAAIESAKGIADRVLQGEFWPPSDKIPLEWDDYRFITQRTVLRPWDPALEDPTATTKQESQVDSEGFDTQTKPKARGVQGPILPKMISIEPVFAEGCPLDEWFEPSMILASAGTGKTYQLASRAIRLLFTDQPLDSILATTFTGYRKPVATPRVSIASKVSLLRCRSDKSMPATNWLDCVRTFTDSASALSIAFILNWPSPLLWSSNYHRAGPFWIQRRKSF